MNGTLADLVSMLFLLALVVGGFTYAFVIFARAFDRYNDDRKL